MGHEDLAFPLVQQMQISKTAARANRILHGSPEPFNRVELVPTAGRQHVQLKLAVVVRQSGGQLFGTMDTTAIGHHDDFLLGVAEDGHDVMDVLPKVVGITMRHECIDDTRGAILDRAADVEQHTAGDPAPGAIVAPRLALEALLVCDLAWAQGACGEAIAPLASPPPYAGQGKAPQGGFLVIKQDDFPSASPLLIGRQFQRAEGEISRVGIKPSGGSAGA